MKENKRVNIKDKRIPVEVRKAAYLEWAKENGIDKKEAQRRARKMFDFVDFSDESIPIGKRKVAYVKWKMHNGTDEATARTLANKIFGFERKGTLVALIVDHGRIHQRSYNEREIYDYYWREIRHYESFEIDYEFCDRSLDFVKKWAKENSTSEVKYVACPLYG